MTETSSSSTAKNGWPMLLVRVAPVKELVTDADDASCHFFRSRRPFHREYDIRIADKNIDDDPICTTNLRFSVFRKRFLKLQATLSFCATMPSRGRFWEDYQENTENVSRRARDMEIFLETVLNSRGSSVAVLRSEHLWQALGLTNQNDRLLDIAKRRVAADREANERRQAKLREIDRQQTKARQKDLVEEQTRWELAQSLNITETNLCSSLTYPKTMRFDLHKKSVQGANQKPWFHLTKANYPSQASYELTTIQGLVPLLELKKRYDMFVYRYSVCYVTKSRKIPMVEVTLKSGTFSPDTFEIIGMGPLAHRTLTSNGSTITMEGRTVANLDKHSALFSSTYYTLTILPNEDCLLILGIACAMTRMLRDRDAAADSAAAASAAVTI